MKKLKRVKELPSWFNLDKYTNSKELSNEQWAEQLQLRSSMIQDLSFSGEIQYYVNEAEVIRKNGLAGIKKAEILNTNHALSHPAVLPISTMDMAIHGEGLLHKIHPSLAPKLSEIEKKEAKRKQEAKELVQEKLHTLFTELTGEDSRNYNKPIIKEFNHTEHDSNLPFDTYRSEYSPIFSDLDFLRKYTHIKINLDFPDTEIKDAFDELLPEYRKLLNIKPSNPCKVSEANIYNLSDYQILPYLDLYIWETQNSLSLNRKVFSQALFPHNSERDKDYLEQTVKVNAFKFISIPFISMLSHAKVKRT